MAKYVVWCKYTNGDIAVRYATSKIDVFFKKKELKARGKVLRIEVWNMVK